MRARRENLALTQTELAERWEVTQNTISRWESGAVKMQHPVILDMALRWLEHEHGERLDVRVTIERTTHEEM